jgi:Fe-S cluster assembly protein SufD
VSRLGLEGFALVQTPRIDESAGYHGDVPGGFSAACLREVDPADVPGGFGVAAGFARLDAGQCTEVALREELREKGVRLVPLELALEEFETPLYRVFGGAVKEMDNRFMAWHYGEWSHGAFLWVPPGLEIREPFFFDFTERAAGALSSPHVTVILGEGARASVIQRIAGGEGPQRMLCNAGVDLLLADAAGLVFCEVQELDPSALYFRHARASVGRDGSLRHFDAAFGGRCVKTRIECGLDGVGAEAHLDGVYFCRKGQQMDIRTVQNHRSQRGSSRAYYKGAVAGGGRTVFQGLIEVAPGASGTDAFLTNRNLILGEAARSDSIPTLKIGNNDVKCSHGSTTGRLNDEELFYLESRGLSVEEAREMLVTGYFEELLGPAPEKFREDSLACILDRLRHAA